MLQTLRPALRVIDGPYAPYKWRLVAIDDDNTNAKHIRYEDVINGYNDKQIDYYDMDGNSINAAVWSRFLIWMSYPVNNDDRYTRSGVMNINLDNFTLRLGGNTYLNTDAAGSGLGDVNWRFRKITY